MSTDMLQFTLTAGEAQVLDAATQIQFGELLSVDLTAEAPSISRQIPKASAAFVEKIREQQLFFFHTIVIHNGFPTQAEIEGKFGEIKYRRKIRFTQ